MVITEADYNPKEKAPNKEDRC